MEAKIEKDHLIIRIPVNTYATLSKSGKSRIVATTNGFVETSALFGKHPVSISINAIIPNPKK